MEPIEHLVLMGFFVHGIGGNLVIVVASLDSVAEMIVRVQILVRRLVDGRVLVYRVVRRLAGVSVEVPVVVVAGRGIFAGTGGSGARTAAGNVRVRELGGQVDRTGLGRQRRRPVLNGRVVMFGFGKTGRMHDRHVDVRYQVQVDHVVVLLEESSNAAAADATDAAAAANAVAVRSGRQVVGRRQRRPQLVVLIADQGPVL